MDVESRPQKYTNLRPPPYRRKVPRYHHKSNRMCSCCKCMCCCCCFLFFFILILIGLSFYLYILYQPRMPTYKVQNLNVTEFLVDNNFGISTELIVTAKAQNPNAWISIVYGERGSVVVTYKDSTLSSGKLPAFKQGHRNTTVLNLALKGKSKLGSEVQDQLMSNQRSGRIPLDIIVKAPVSLDIGSLRMPQLKVLVVCNLVVNSLSPEEDTKILSSSYKFMVNL